jgi:hypothetical protein
VQGTCWPGQQGDKADWPRGHRNVCSTRCVVLTFDVMDSLVIGDFQCPRDACFAAMLTWGRINSRATWTDLEIPWPGDMQTGYTTGAAVLAKTNTTNKHVRDARYCNEVLLRMDDVNPRKLVTVRRSTRSESALQEAVCIACKSSETKPPVHTCFTASRWLRASAQQFCPTCCNSKCLQSTTRTHVHALCARPVTSSSLSL